MTLISTDHRHRVTHTYFLAFVAIGMSGGLLGPALPHLAEMTGSSMSQIALLFTARALGNMLGAVSSGLLVDRLPGHRVLIAMLVPLAAGLAAVPLSQALMPLVALVFLLGFCEMSVNAGANTLLLWTHGTRSAPWISALHFCFGLGNMLVPMVLVAALSLTGLFHGAFWLVAALALALCVPLARLSSPRQDTVNRAEREPPPPGDAWRLALFLLLFSLYVGTEITFAGWITAYASLSGESPGDAALLVTLFWMTLSAGRLAAIPLLRRFTPWRMLRLCLGLGVLSGVSLQFGWLPLPLIALLFGLACSAIFPTLFGLSNQLMVMSGRTTGLIFLAASSGAMAVPSLAGPLLEGLGTGSFPLLLCALMGLMALGMVTLRARVARTSGAGHGDQASATP
ncbi:MFS transporter [Halomonas aestuarii]|uniref:MFS transporter n=1 Tax=Halomonas aestuarii TaxID=1897729 RepID=A0A1J0VEC0_9GAMM|nr:MFS transporter [Halomonas aestuarii]APE30392.1 MFS transporter [Halomonas aestuarii]